MPLPDSHDRPDDLSPGGRLDWIFAATASSPVTRAISPAAILESVRSMSPDERAELADLLGVESPHSMLYLPANSGGFLPPAEYEAEPPWLIRARALPEAIFD